jgi:hypothetical protein
MRSPGVIYRRYRQLKKKIIYDKMESAHQIKHENCTYGRVVLCTKNGKTEPLKICGYNLNIDNNTIEICDDPVSCNAFICKWNKEKVLKQTEEEFANPDTKRMLYPEITVMEWVLDKNLNDAVKSPNFFGRIIVRCIEFLEDLLKEMT